MPKPKVLALSLAGGEGSRLELLTERRAKPALPYAGVYRLEVFAFGTDRRLGTLEELVGRGDFQDFGHGLLPRLVEAGEAVEHRMAGYWRDVGTVPAYWQAHMDLLDPERPLDLDDPDWPVLCRAPHRLPALVGGPGGDGPALVAEEAQVPRGTRVPLGGRDTPDGPREAT
jgi:glucose-1-phosphate adenylyltransferase